MDALKRFRRKTKDNEGFICPNCMVNLSSPEQLQSHWEAVHNVAAQPEPEIQQITEAPVQAAPPPSTLFPVPYQTESQNSGDLLVAKQEIEELKVSLKEEKWYSEELKRDLDKVNYLHPETPVENGMEVQILREDMKKVEENKSLLASEVVLLRQELTEARDNSNTYKQMKDAMEQKAAKLAGVMANFQADLDEERSKKCSFEETLKQTQLELRERDSQLKAMESQLLERPDGDDVTVLKKELVTIQTLMDENSLQAESGRENLEKQFKEEHEKCNHLQEEIKQTRTEYDAMKEKYDRAPKLEEVARLEATVSSSSASGQFLQDQLQSLQDQSSKLQEQLSESQTKFHESELQSQKLEQELSFMKDQHHQQTSNKDERFTSLQEQLNKLSEAKEEKEKELESSKKELSDLRNSTEETQRKQEQNLVAVQGELSKLDGFLKEKESLVTDLEQQLNGVQSQVQEETTKSDSIQAQLREKTAQIQEQERFILDRDSRIGELEETLQKHKTDCDRLETEREDLIVKIEAGEGTETVIQQLKQENDNLQDQVEYEQKQQSQKSEEQRNKIEDLYKQLQETKGVLETENNKFSRTEASLTEVNIKLSTNQEKTARLDAEVKAKSELLTTQETTLTTQRADLESHLRTSKNALDDKQKELERLQLQIQQMSGETSHSRDKCMSLEEEKSSLQESLTSSQHEYALLQTDLKNKENLMSTFEANRVSQKLEVDAQILRLQNEIALKTQECKDSSERVSKVSSELSSTQSSLAETKTLLLETTTKYTTEQQAREGKATELSECQSLLTNTMEELTSLQDQFEKVKSENSLTVEGLQKQKATIEESLSSEKISLQNQVQSLSTEKGALEKVTNGLKADLEVRSTKLKERDSQLQLEKVLVIEKTKSEADLKKEVTELETLRDQLVEKLKLEKTTAGALRHQNSEKEAKQTEQAKTIMNLEQQLQKKEEIQIDMQKKVEILEQEVAKRCEQCTNYESQMVKLQTNFSKEEEKCTALQSELEGLHNTLNNTEAALERVRDSEGSLQSRLDGLQQVKDELDGKVKNLDDQQRQAEKFLQDLKNQQLSLQDDLQKEREIVQGLQEDKQQLNNDLEAERQTLQKEKNDRAEDVGSLQQAKQLLIGQKLALQSQVGEKESELSRRAAELEESKEVAKKVQNMMREESAALQNKLTAETHAKAEAEKLREEMEQRYNLQITALNENLGTLREVMLQSDSRCRELEKNTENLKGELHVMEASIQNSQDERRALLERCLKSENEVEKLQIKTSEMRRKLEDAQAAMHELGRENQSLQIAQTKSMSRKWIEDKDVLNCMSCQKFFTLAVRKHHCRNCGDIFCHECSMKNATVASSKKPVRVCETCYAELTR